MTVPLRLADVVQQHAQHQQLGFLDFIEDLGGAFGLCGLAGRDRFEVLDAEQRMLIGREAVVHVVLHQTRQCAELRQVGAEQAELVHLRQRQRHPAPAPGDVEEEVPHDRRAPEPFVDEVQRVLDRPLEIERELAAETMQVPEDLHDAGGIAPQQTGVAVDEMQPTVEEDEAVGERLLALAPLRRATPGQRFLAARDESARDAVDHACVQIVVAHEPLDTEALTLVLVPEIEGDARLDVTPQHVVLVAGHEVQSVAHAPEEREGGVGASLLARGDQPLVGQLAERTRAELGGAEPHGRVDVAQPTRRFLHVRLADVRRRAMLPVPLVAFGQCRGEELLEVVAVDVVAQHAAEPGEEPAVAGDEPRLLHRRAAREVRARHGHAIVERAQAVPDLEAQIPHRVEQLLREALHERRQLAVVDDHQIDVRRRMELAAAVPSERHDDVRCGRQSVGGRVGRDERREGVQDFVDEARVGLHRLLARCAARVHLLEGLESLGERSTKELEAETAPVLRALGARFGATRPAKQRGRHDAAERTVRR